MAETFDGIVIGVGGFGGGTLCHLAKRGVRALEIEQFGVAHDRGSSHGETRIIRKAYFEHPDYVPLLYRAYDLWRELEAERSLSLMNLCGLMLAGPAEGEAISGARLSARLHGVPIEDISDRDACNRFPGFRFQDDWNVVYEADAGFLHVENCVQAHIESARRHGAQIRTGETVTHWESNGRTVRVRTDVGEYFANYLVFTSGAWTKQLLPALKLNLRVVRKPVSWHEVRTSDYHVDRGAPVFYFERTDGDFYGCPSLDGEVIKVAEHSGGNEVADPSALDRALYDDDIRPIQRFITETLTDVAPQPVRHSVCMYTHSVDGHFLLGYHPDFANVLIAAGFSGHGFKFTSVLGEALAQMIVDGNTPHPIGFLSLDRLLGDRTA